MKSETQSRPYCYLHDWPDWGRLVLWVHPVLWYCFRAIRGVEWRDGLGYITLGVGGHEGDSVECSTIKQEIA